MVWAQAVPASAPVPRVAQLLPAFISNTVWEGASEDLLIAFPWKFRCPNAVDD